MRTSPLPEFKFHESIQSLACWLQLPTKISLMSANSDGSAVLKDQRGQNLLWEKCSVFNQGECQAKKDRKKAATALNKYSSIEGLLCLVNSESILNLIRKIKFAYFSCFTYCAGKERICCHIHILRALFFPQTFVPRTWTLNLWQCYVH